MKNTYAYALLPVIIAIGIAFVSCSAIEQRRAAQHCRFEIADIEVAKFSLSDMSLSLQLKVANPGTKVAVIDKMDLYLYIEDRKTVNVIFSGVSVPPGATKTMNALLSVPYSAMGMSLANIAKSNGAIRYRLAGTAYMNTTMGVVKLPVTITKN
ncbi:MAG: LEA type 2 family protein [Spirochaetes bacterium]|nr:LEA type 2 family protein [Spirochaetota bacterium]